MVKYAQLYRERGLSVIPLGKDKRPLITSWVEYQKKQATEEEIANWWAKFPEANVGIVCGEISGITVIDFDVKKKDGKVELLNGGVIFSPRIAEFRKYNTLTVKTGSGGYHMYYKYSSDIKTGVNFFKEEVGIDIRNDGSYVMAPPSIHENGNKYQVVAKGEFAELPVQLFGEKPKIQSNVAEFIEGVGRGERNNTAAKVAGWLVNKTQNGDRSIAWGLFQAWNKQNNPPLSDGELKTVFNSISRREDLKPKEQEERIPEETPIMKISEAAKRQLETPREFYKTGFNTLDEAMRGGMMVGDLNIFTGATGQGKTSICQTITYNLAQQEIPSLWFSFEVMIEEIWRKFMEMGVNDDFISYTPFKIATGNVAWLEQKIKEAKETFGVKVVFVDHLGFLTKNINSMNKAESMQNNFALYLGSICRQLKSIAIDNGIVICLLVHTKKLADKDNETNINDIAHSAGIAQEADNVFMIRRVRANSIGPDGNVYAPESILKMEKNRRTGINKSIVVNINDGKFIEKGQPVTELIKKHSDKSFDDVLSEFSTG